ncbi:MAG: hypothetical protein HY921_07745 [Elusimicrobia bacterium]|nr:hypothetical protein [Elusimicrobiota bacterium]
MKDLESFKQTISREFLEHPVILENRYTRWFAGGEAAPEQVRDLLIQFSVFSNYFLVIQAKRMVLAATEEAERCARQILVNECGVGLDAESGSAEGRTFSSSNAHLNWLRQCARPLGLGPMELGRWESASPATRNFLKGLERNYSHPDPSVGAGASFAVENWASHGIGGGAELETHNFWSQLISGLEAFNERERLPQGLEPLPLGFFRWHFEVESGHRANVWEALERDFSRPDFNPRKFLKGGRAALDSVRLFWTGLDEARQQRERPSLRSAPDHINVAQWAV